MLAQVDTKDPTLVEVEVQTLYMSMYPAGDWFFVPQVFGWAIDCFTGVYDNYQPIDARYHDFEHTLQGTLCLARLLHGYFKSAPPLPLPQKIFELGMLGILLHDTGYLKKRDDVEGTGAKYTLTHVNRSAEFARELLTKKGFSDAQIRAVQNMIRCTGVNVDLASIPFQNELERLVGYALGSADLLGQMAAHDYIDKLPILYLEFAESASYNGGKMTTGGNFASAEDLIKRTPLFWEKYVLPKITNDFRGMFNFLRDPFPDGPNEYLERIQGNLDRLRGNLAVASQG